MGLLPRRPKSLIVDNPPPIPTSSGGESLSESFSEPHDDEDEDCKLVLTLVRLILKRVLQCTFRILMMPRSSDFHFVANLCIEVKLKLKVCTNLYIQTLRKMECVGFDPGFTSKRASLRTDTECVMAID